MRDERHVERASAPLVPATMPEIWNDPIASDQFSDSFFEYISYRLNMPSKPLIVKSIQKNCGLEEGDDLNDIRNKIEHYILHNGWSDDNWLEK